MKRKIKAYSFVFSAGLFINNPAMAFYNETSFGIHTNLVNTVPMTHYNAVSSFINDVKNGVYDDDTRFSPELKKMILNSNPEKDWLKVGSKGIMLFRGEVWLDIEGTLSAVNYKSSSQIQEENKRIKEERKALHKSIRKFERPVLELETEKFKIRIDYMGDSNYRYSSWPLKKDMKNKPDLVLENGKIIFMGSGGNVNYEFENNKYKYECIITRIGLLDSPPMVLNVYNGNDLILSQEGKIIKERNN